MDSTITLSQSKLASFLACQRQFQLRFLERIAWPSEPLPARVATAVSQGQQFHQLIERHLLGLPIDTRDQALRRWWSFFKSSPPAMPAGKKLIESSLTIPIDLPDLTRRTYLLNGRFDLLIIGQPENGAPFAHIFDWKTGKPRPTAELQRDWQTRLYFAMLAEGGHAFFAKDSAPLLPENIYFTYWYVAEPDEPRTLAYSKTAHAQNWADIQAIVQQLDALEDGVVWPLTDDLTICAHCAYQIICGRQNAGTAVTAISADDEQFAEVDHLEPERP